jgi:biotin carboxyl carrier protein
VGTRTYVLKLKQGTATGSIVVEVADRPVTIILDQASNQEIRLRLGGERLTYRRQSASPRTSAPQIQAAAFPAPKDVLAAPMPGRVTGAMAKKGDEVQPGDPLVVIESMKMEVAVRSDRRGTVDQVLVSEGSVVRRGQALVKFRA